MMDKWIVNENVVHFLREKQRQFTGLLGEVQAFANERRIPIIPHETAVFLDFLMGQVKPTKILEIGAAIGFSGLLLASHLPEDGVFHTIDRYDLMITRARENFAKSEYGHKMTVIEGDAADVLPTLHEQYDVIFMDSAKAKYYEFLPLCLRCLKTGGLLIVDDVFQGATIFDDESTIPKRVRKIHRQLNRFMDVVNNHPSIKTTTLPLGDGIVICEKLNDIEIELDSSVQ
ncbi:O-methyltransferase [Carnobacteriaceae bacterium zg-ZUI252]|nr:O-methyltransferase [Carnobacteriaceae bacterium zg-ZUI252]MBS4770752.1 O-methyltransferase [Carnobacteriaceae bacterium zg-ZUI240]QTU83606.1 O-methyltransferase [Carnobacteriaceae bacterium zg-C25]